jgi:putative transposase
MGEAGKMELASTDQLWVVDIAYIRLETEFVYLAVALNAYWRCVIGWSLERTLDVGLPVNAVRMALDRRSPAPVLAITPTRAACIPRTSIPTR